MYKAQLDTIYTELVNLLLTCSIVKSSYYLCFILLYAYVLVLMWYKKWQFACIGHASDNAMSVLNQPSSFFTTFKGLSTLILWWLRKIHSLTYICGLWLTITGSVFIFIFQMLKSSCCYFSSNANLHIYLKWNSNVKMKYWVTN